MCGGQPRGSEHVSGVLKRGPRRPQGYRRPGTSLHTICPRNHERNKRERPSETPPTLRLLQEGRLLDLCRGLLHACLGLLRRCQLPLRLGDSGLLGRGFRLRVLRPPASAPTSTKGSFKAPRPRGCSRGSAFESLPSLASLGLALAALAFAASSFAFDSAMPFSSASSCCFLRSSA